MVYGIVFRTHYDTQECGVVRIEHLNKLADYNDVFQLKHSLEYIAVISKNVFFEKGYRFLDRKHELFTRCFNDYYVIDTDFRGSKDEIYLSTYEILLKFIRHEKLNKLV